MWPFIGSIAFRRLETIDARTLELGIDVGAL